MAVSRPRDNGGQEPATLRLLEPRPFRPFKSSEEYLYAMKEDLAEWLNTLYELEMSADSFCDVLDTGVVLCRHANQVREAALEFHKSGRNGLKCPIPKGPTYRTDVSTNTFHARDNVSNFITWCRALEIRDCLLFETDDLVMRKNEKSVILCLLEVARRGSKVGMLAPLLVQMEEEIDREIAEDSQKRLRGEDRATSPQPSLPLLDYPPSYGPHKQIIVNDLKSLDEMVRDLVNRCACPTQFFIERISEGKYRIGDTKILIFVRILRSHVMVRVGGGWDTLAHYLDKHDPCRCRQGHRSAVSSKLTVKFGQGNPAETQMGVSYIRSPLNGVAPPCPAVPVRQTSPVCLPPPLPTTSPPRQRRISTSSSSSSSHKLSNSSLASLPGEKAAVGHPGGGEALDVGLPQQQSFGDSSSEHSDEGYRSSASRLPSMERSGGNPPNTLLMVTEGDGSAADVVVSPCPSPLDPYGRCPEHQAAVPEPSRSGRAVPPRSLDVPRPPSTNVPVQYETVVPLDFTSGGGDKRPIHSSTSNLLGDTGDRRRRFSGDQRLVNGVATAQMRRMPRSRSSHGNDANIGDFARNQGPRFSYRSLRGSLPPGPHSGPPPANHTWSSPRRVQRPPLTADMFNVTTPPGRSSQSAGASPLRYGGSPRGRQSHGGVGGSLQTSPIEHLPQVMQEFINKGMYKDEKILELLRAVMSEPSQQAQDHQARHRHSSSGNSQGIASPRSPDSGSDVGFDHQDDRPAPDGDEPGPSASNRDVRLKISPRKDNHPNTGSKIPVPKYEALLSLQ